VESKGIIGPEQAGFRKNRCTSDHLIKIDHDIKKGFKDKQAIVADFLDINKAYDSVWTRGLLYKLSKIGIHGNCLGWLSNFLCDRSIAIRLGGHTSNPRKIFNGVPQVAVISPLLFNVMLYDFPAPPPVVTRLLFADDVTLYAKADRPIDSEPILQPYINKVSKWGRKWKFRFSASKSAVVSFTRQYKPGDDPLLFLDGHRIPNSSKIKFLGLILDSKLLWKSHTQMVADKCIRLKNAFSIITKATYAPSFKSLCTLFKCLVRSRIDYGLPIYGSACISTLLKIDVAARSILRLILGSKPSTPKEILYAETGTEPLADRGAWLSARYHINLSHHPENLTYQTAKNLFYSSEQWPPRCCPSLKLSCEKIRHANMDLFKLPAGTTDQLNKQTPPWSPPQTTVKWFPMRKNEASVNQDAVHTLFDKLKSNITAPDITVYTDGSLSESSNTTSCAFFIPETNSSGSWCLSSGSSVFSAELHGIKQALATMYTYDPPPPAIHIFSDSSASIKAIISSQPPKNRCVGEIRNLLGCLKSSGTIATLYWIPSHTGIAGNKEADRLASEEAHSPSGNIIENDLSPGEQLSILKTVWDPSFSL
jgi:ribonuclease HI